MAKRTTRPKGPRTNEARDQVERGTQAGYSISESEKDAVKDVGGSDTYGELLPQSTLRLIRALALSSDDVFFDLGCGVGKVLCGEGWFSNLASSVRSDLGSR